MPNGHEGLLDGGGDDGGDGLPPPGLDTPQVSSLTLLDWITNVLVHLLLKCIL